MLPWICQEFAPFLLGISVMLTKWTIFILHVYNTNDFDVSHN